MFSLKQDDENDTFRVKRTIGSSYITDEDDVRKTKSALNATGDYKPPKWGMTGITDDGIFDGLKKFQKREGLEIDGIMRPGGPTEKKLRERTSAVKLASATNRPSSTPAGVAGIVAGEHDQAHRKTDIFGNPMPQSKKPKAVGEQPSLGEIEIDLDLPNRTDDDRDRSQETQVAVLPLVNLLAQAANRFGPVIARSLPPAIGLADKADKESVMRRQKGEASNPLVIPPIPEEWQNREKPQQRQQADPPPPTPGFEAQDRLDSETPPSIESILDLLATSPLYRQRTKDGEERPEDECDAQFATDISVCKVIAEGDRERFRRCEKSASERYANCIAGRPLGPLDEGY